MENATDKTIINLRGYLALLLTKKNAGLLQATVQ